MSDKRATDLTELTTVADDDLLYIVDVSDATDSSAGSSRKAQAKNVRGWPVTAAETASAVTVVNYQYPELDVRRYGAAGDGVTDDTTAIQSAINVATVYGGAVYLPSTTAASSTATYLVSAAIELKSHVRLVGDTNWTLFNSFGTGDTPVKNATIIKLANSSNDNVIEFVQDCICAGIENVYIDGNKANQTSGVGIQFVNNATRTRGRNWIKNVYVYGAYGDGINIPDHVEEVFVDDTYIDRCGGNGIEVIGQDCQFGRVWTGYNGENGVEITGGGADRFYNCDSFGNTNAGYYIHDVKTIRFVNCQSNGNEQEGIKIAKATGAAGTLYTSGYAPSRITFSACSFFNNSQETDDTPANTFDEVLLTSDTTGPFAVKFLGCEFGIVSGAGFCDYAINDSSGTVRTNAVIGCQFESSEYTVSTFNGVEGVYQIHGCLNGSGPLYSITAFAANDATPSVKTGNMFYTANSSPTTITDFDDGKTGQVIHVLINDANTTIDFTGSSLKGIHSWHFILVLGTGIAPYRTAQHDRKI